MTEPCKPSLTTKALEGTGKLIYLAVVGVFGLIWLILTHTVPGKLALVALAGYMATVFGMNYWEIFKDNPFSFTVEMLSELF